MAHPGEDPHLGAGPSEDSELSENESETASLVSEDSIMPDYEMERGGGGTTSTLYEACDRNEALTLRKILERGVTKEEVMELDINGRNGLMLAVSRGYIDIVYGLHTCPLIDINHQDSEGNTALMIAAQAGFISILNFILNYYPKVDLEMRDMRGFTALIKAAMQGREDCVSSLIMAGANINVVDEVRGKGIRDWAMVTGRFEVLQRLRVLQARPIAEQFCDSYTMEWPELEKLVAKAMGPKTLTQRLRDNLTISFPKDPQDNGVMDHMVRMTTSIHSPLVSTGCRPLCPTSPPEVGKRRLAVPELMERHGSKDLEESSVCHSNGVKCSFTPTPAPSRSLSLANCCSNTERRGSVLSTASNTARNFLPRSLAHRNSVFPSSCIPKITYTKSPNKTPKKAKKKKMHKGYLEPPVWKYKSDKQEKKMEKERLEEEKQTKEKAIKKAKKKAAKAKDSAKAS
ncbi:photoreceptor ankyrin repeat protein [Esox lucius]|uniref:Ankyrin repeat domain 33Aa n=1 Tax=Esox lucius TaxID=8010 RepID=A0A3P8XUN7_ESOLU|nr:photoreceptor ankyrin repeat protein [Esox lucius]XP_010873425.2 photoreceptor ankyrin repeat protein [Esox lucius]